MSVDVPNGWVSCTLDDLFEFVRGSAFPAGEKGMEPRPGAVACLRTANVQVEIDWDDLWFIPASYIKNEIRFLRVGDTLMSTANSGPVVGKVAFVDRLVHRPAAFGAFISVLRSRPPLVPRWVYLRLASSEMQARIRATASQTTNIANVSAKSLLPLEAAFPPRGEQRRIVEEIDALFAHSNKAKQSLDRIPALLDKLKKSILAAAFRGDLTRDWRERNPDVEPADVLLERIRHERRKRWEEAELAKMRAKGKEPKGDAWKAKYEEPEPVNADGLPELPPGWVWAPIELLSDSVRVIRYGILKPGPDVPDGVPYVKVRNIRGGVVLEEELLRTTREMHEQFKGAELAHGDFLVTIRGTWGRVAPVPRSLAGGNITQDSARIAPLRGAHRDYLMQALRGPAAVAFLNSVAKGMAVKGVNIGDLRRTPIPLAPEREQVEVVRLLGEAESMVAGVGRGTDKSSRRRLVLDQAILAKAFRGELVPQDPNDEPASVLLERIRAERAQSGDKPKRGTRRRGNGKPDHPPAPTEEPNFAPVDEADALGRLESALQQVGELTTATAQDATGLSPTEVRPLLKKLVEIGLAKKTGAGRGTRYVAA